MKFLSVADWHNHFLTSNIKLHLGCGSRYWDGWCNIDAYPANTSDTHRGININPDIWADISNLPADKLSIDAIATQHVFEHFYRHDACLLLDYFYTLLKPGGLLITEMPDISRVAPLYSLNIRPHIFKSSSGSRQDVVSSQFYGASWEANSQGYPYHKYVWERNEFCESLVSAGYEIVLATGATLSHVPFRDMAVIARKPSSNPINNTLKNLELELVSTYGSPPIRFMRQLKSFSRLVLNSVKTRIL